APNVHNYISRADVLHRMVVAGGLQDRIIGNQIAFDGTSMGWSFLGANHVGSDRGKPDTTPYDGSMAVPFSLFHADRVVSAGRYGALVDITVDNLLLMVDGLQLQRDELLAVLGVELVGVEGELRAYAAELSAREEAVRQALMEVVEERYAPVRRAVEELGDQVERVLRSPLVTFPSPPGPLRLVWRPVQQAASAAVDDLIGAVQEIGDFAARAAADAAWQAWRRVFVDESAAVAEVLAEQSVVLQGDLRLVDAKWARFAETAGVIADAVAQADEAAAAAIASRSCAPDAVPVTIGPWPLRAVAPLEEDAVKQFHQTTVDERQRVAGDLVAKVGAALAAAMLPVRELIARLLLALEAAEGGLGLAQGALRTAAKVAAFTPAALLTGTSDDLDRFQQRVGELYADLRAASDEWQDAISRIGAALDRVPEAVLMLQDYLEQSFFSDAQLETAYDAFLKCRNLVERSETAFGEAGFQLEEHSASAVDALADRAGNLERDLATVAESLTEMVS
ncbi:MAG TPA: hypothetical protein VGC37_09565, partial [Friedmanniella sp.]